MLMDVRRAWLNTLMTSALRVELLTAHVHLNNPHHQSLTPLTLTPPPTPTDALTQIVCVLSEQKNKKSPKNLKRKTQTSPQSYGHSWWIGQVCVRLRKRLGTCSVWLNCEQGMDFCGAIMWGRAWGTDDSAKDESHAPVMNANWGVIMAGAEISPIWTWEGEWKMKTTER